MTAAELVLAWRSLRGMPLAAAVIILSLAVGIGVNTVVFSWIQALVLHPLPGVARASEIHLIEPQFDSGGRPGASWPEYEDLRARLDGVANLVAFRMLPLTVGEPGQAERAYGLLISDNYFGELGLAAAAGRFPTPEELSRGAAMDVAVASYDYWQAHLGGSTEAIGRPLRINQREVTVIGVAPEGFLGTVLGLQFDLWLPAGRAPLLLAGSPELDDRGIRGYYLMARLGRQAVPQASALVDAEMRELAGRFPATNAGVSAGVLPFWRASRGPQGLLLQGVTALQAVLLTLLLAICANTANLLLARAAGRRSEVGVRLSLGAGPWRIVRLLLAENLLMALAAAALGVVFAVWGTDAMRSVPVLSTAFPVRFDTGLDAGTVLFAVAIAALAAVACGAAPAWFLARLDPVRAIRGDAMFGPKNGLRHALMAGEVALALVVLLIAGLFYRSFSDTRGADPGFQQEGLLLAAYDLSGRGRDGDAARQFAERVLGEVRALAGVEAAAIASSVPLDIHGLPPRSFALAGRPRTDGARDRALSNIVTPGYFETMRIPFLEGRDLPPLADREAPPSIVVNQAFVDRFLPDGTVLGRDLESGGRTYRIVGVVRTSLSDAFGEPAMPAMYFSYRDRPAQQGEIHLRTRPGGETALAPAVRRAMAELDATLPVYNVRTMTDHVETNLFLRRIPARLFSVLGPLLLVLAAGGVYAVTAYAVASRRREVGVRLALGASPGRVIGQIVRECLRFIGAGAAVGWLLVYVAYIHLAPGSPLPALVFAGIPITLGGVAAAACWLPARRAGRVDPAAALREAESRAS